MFGLRLFAALWMLALSAGAASAQDWSVVFLQGAARAFTDGEWTALRVGDAAPKGGVLRTEVGSRLLIGREDDILSVAPLSKFDIEGDDARALVRVFDATIGVVEREAPGQRFIVMTSAAELVARGAEFGVVADAAGAAVSVRRGLVLATDLATRRTVEVRAGETFRVLLGRAGTVETTAKADPALKAAEDAAGGGPGGAASLADAAASGDATSSKLDRVPTGALPGDGAKADPALVESAADAVHEQRRRAKLGKADPRAVAAVQSIESDLLQGIDVEAQPWDDDFEWTEMEDGQLRLKPISRIVLGLRGAERFEFWTLFVLVCLILGGVANAVLQETGFGSLFNALLVMTAFVAAVLVRDLFLRGGANLALEPFLSMGMMMSAMPLLLLSGAFAKMRWRL
jgi:hypothetical protein